MRLPYEAFIASRYLRAKRRQGFISIITLISIVGVAIGVMALILVLGVMTGFTDDLREKILGTNSHIVVTRFGVPLREYEEALETVRGVRGVVAATPFVVSQVMVSSGSHVSGVVLQGIDVATAPGVIMIEKNIVAGDLQQLAGVGGSDNSSASPGIIIGSELSKILGAYPGNDVTVISPTGFLSPAGMVPRWKKFRVMGIFESGMYEYDTTIAYIAISAAQQFLKMPGEVTGIEIKVTDIYKTAGVVARLRERLGSSYNVRDWKDMHRNLYSALKLEKTAMFIILTLIIIVAAFSIVATLVMMVNDKNRDIAILKSMGATSNAIMKIFILQGLVIGAVGTTLGMAGGWFLAFLQNHYHIVSLSKDVYYIPALTVQVGFWDIFWVAFSAMVISFLATLYPSRQAARLEPAEALRYE